MSPRDPNAHSHSTLLESSSPEPTLLKVCSLVPETDYRKQAWKNGLGTTTEIAIYPPNTDFKKDPFLWRLSVTETRSDSTFCIFPGYDCTMIVLPNKKSEAPSLLLRHQDTEALINVKPLFPYTWEGQWTTSCRITNGPISSIHFMLNKSFGTAQSKVITIGASATEAEDNKILMVGAFALVYVVKGSCCISLDEHRSHARTNALKQGQCLYIERDQEAGPSQMDIRVGSFASDSTKGSSTESDDSNEKVEVTLVVIQVAESTAVTEQPHTERRPSALPSEIRQGRRNSSLVVCPNQPDSAIKTPEDISLNTPREELQGAQPTWDSTQIYEPPSSAFFHFDSEMPPPMIRDRLVIEDYPLHTTSTAWIKMMTQGMNEWLKLPVIVCRGSADGPVVGITAAVHGNELNGVPCIHKVASSIDVQVLRGTLVAIPCVNVTGYLKFQREFSDGRDLNRMFPGKEDGFASQVYCFHIMNKIISQFNYHIDLHTASFGRVNSFYVRADMNDSGAAMLAQLQKPQIILHNSGQDGTLRSAAATRGIKSITVEIGNPQMFQEQFVEWSFMGVMRILNKLDMFPLENVLSEEKFIGPTTTILCSKGFWIYTKTGGVLEVYPDVNTIIRKGDIIARVKSMFGNVIEEYDAPCAGVVIGRSSNPVAMAGDRIIHLGIIKRKGEVLMKEAKENY
ncbi:hypothetical protein F4703DRAFT_1868243 [Phycomyces blakesleeanus]